MLWVGLGIVAVVFVVWFIRRNGTKEKTVDAKVAKKTATPHHQRGSEDASLPTDYLVVFEADGKNISLLVSHSFYDSVQVGAKGKLTHKGDVFVDFEDNDPRLRR